MATGMLVGVTVPVPHPTGAAKTRAARASKQRVRRVFTIQTHPQVVHGNQSQMSHSGGTISISSTVSMMTMMYVTLQVCTRPHHQKSYQHHQQWQGQSQILPLWRSTLQKRGWCLQCQGQVMWLILRNFQRERVCHQKQCSRRKIRIPRISALGYAIIVS